MYDGPGDTRQRGIKCGVADVSEPVSVVSAINGVFAFVFIRNVLLTLVVSVCFALTRWIWKDANKLHCNV